MLLQLAIASLAALFVSASPSPHATGHNLNPGDILYADSGNAVDGGFLIKVDPETGAQAVISSGGYLSLPLDLALGQRGEIVVLDASGRLIGINPNTAQQTVILDNAHGELGVPCGIALARRGDVFIANTQAILRFEPISGRMVIVSVGGNLAVPLWVAAANNGDLFVLNRGLQSNIVEVNPRSGAQIIISEGGYLKSPQALAISGALIYVTDVATSDGNFGIGRIIEVNRLSGAQRVVSEGNLLVGPVGIAVDGKGQLIVGDPYTVNLDSPDVYDGAIIKIDPVTGEQKLITSGQGAFVNPRGVAVVP